MAYDKIIAIRSRLDRCLAYTANEEKTRLSDALTFVFTWAWMKENKQI